MATTIRVKRSPRYFALHIFNRIIIYIILFSFAFVFLYPFYNMFIGSFMDDSELFSKTPTFWPKSFDLESYTTLFALESYNYGRALFNTFLIATVLTIGTLFFSSLAGFAYAKRNFPGRDRLFMLMLISLFFPTQATLIPWYLLMVQKLQWGNTYWPFWVPAWASAFGIFWMRQYIKATVPDEILDAAAIDGCSPWGTFLRVVLPVIVPGMAVLGILTFVAGFNDFLGPLLILNDPDLFTAQLVLANFKGTTVVAPRYSVMFAGGALATLPLILVFFIFQKQLIEGVMSGAVKG
ncbi:MAG: carbohydrate ABC transporter permease [Chloroflexota bacterium]